MENKNLADRYKTDRLQSRSENDAEALAAAEYF